MPDQRSGIWPKFERVVEKISSLTGFVAGLAILSAALIVTEGVVSRKVFGMSTIWQIELSVFLLIYACFAGAALGQKNEHHLNVDLAIVYLRPRAREILLLVASVLTCIICVVLAIYAWPMWWQALVHNEHSESLWGPPLWIPYLFLPLGATLLFLQYLVQIARKIRILRRGTYGPGPAGTELREARLSPAHGSCVSDPIRSGSNPAEEGHE